VEPRIQYARTADDVRIAFTTLGSGPAIVFTPPATFGNLVAELNIPEHRRFADALAEDFTVVFYDSRDGGSSQRQVADVTLEGHMRDLQAVADKLALESFYVFGFYHTSLAAILYAARYPERVRKLVLWHSYASAAERDPAPISPIRSLRETSWEVYTETLARTGFGWANDEAASLWARSIRQSITADDVARMLEAQEQFDVRDCLSEVKCPTLLLYRKDSRRYSTDWALSLASQIAGAQLQLLPGDQLVYSAGDSEVVLRVLREFFSDEKTRYARPAPQQGGSIVTILFTDIEDHTSVMRSLGDEKGRLVLREHESIMREALRRHGGTEVKTMGDGFMASFASAYRALECAIAMQKAFEARNETAAVPLRVRIGLNAGEPIAEDDDLFGSAVILAARTAAKARGGEIYVTDVVRQLAAGKGFLFSDLGETELRGFEDPVRLYELNWH